ncbi:HPF/RaiA family ribosome-associated protein [soil metagenome]
MQVQLNTDHHVVGTVGLSKHVEEQVSSALARFADKITRVEVHINDLNSTKAGGDDKRCMIEARINGRPPVSVTHEAPSVGQAIDGAVHKAERAIEKVFGKLEAHRHDPIPAVGADDAV